MSVLSEEEAQHPMRAKQEVSRRFCNKPPPPSMEEANLAVQMDFSNAPTGGGEDVLQEECGG